MIPKTDGAGEKLIILIRFHTSLSGEFVSERLYISHSGASSSLRGRGHSSRLYIIRQSRAQSDQSETIVSMNKILTVLSSGSGTEPSDSR